MLRPARSLEAQFVPPRLRGARLDPTRSAYKYDAVGDTFVGVEMAGRATSVRAAKVRDALIHLAGDFLVGRVALSRHFEEHGRIPASAFSLRWVSAVLREEGWRLAAAPLPLVEVGAYEMVQFSMGSGAGETRLTIVRPTSSYHLRTPFTPPAERGREFEPSTSAFMHDDVGDTFAAVRLTLGGNSEDANALLQRLVTRPRGPR
ncbi:MAG TPA: hypothetical protein VGF99_01215 [Myxococcota bacterium]